MASFFVNCQTQKKASNTDSRDTMSKLEHQAEESLEGKVVCESNRDTTYLLCVRTDGDQISSPATAFVIYDIKTQEVVHEGKLALGSVSWFNTSQIQIVKSPEMIKKDQDSKAERFIYDLQKKEYIKQNQQSNIK